MDSKKVCRVCLKPEQTEYISLYEKYKQHLIFEYINAITCMNVTYNDGLPDKICLYCFKQLQTAINFKEKCEESNNYFQEIALKSSLFNGDNNIKNDEFKEKLIKSENENEEEFFSPDTVESRDYEDTNINNIVIESLSIRNPKKPEYKQFQCHDCGNMFNSKCKLRVHWKREHVEKILVCDNCKRTFKSAKALQSHKERKTRSCITASDRYVSITGLGRYRVFSCRECNYRTSRIKDIATHIVIHSGERPYQCDLCPKNFTQHSSLQFHKECAHTDSVVQMTCHFCGKYIKGRRRLQRHLKLHTNTKVTCPVCKRVISKLSYNTHMKRHSGVKSYTCEKCASTFYTSAELCNHKRWVHIKKRELNKCDLCDYKCAKLYRLRLHKSKHTDKNFACACCGRFYLSLEKLAAHERSHYDEKKFSCPQCNVKFFNRYSVTKHMKTKHPIAIMAERKAIEERKDNGMQKKGVDINIMTAV